MKYLLLIFSLLFCLGCSTDPNDPENPTYLDTSLTIIVYMVADNNLYSNAYYDIQEMEYALSTINTDANVVVYVDSESYSQFGDLPQIIKIEADTDTKTIASTVVKTYDERNSVDPAIINSTLNDIIEIFPSDNYGLVLWSHASGWVEATLSSDNAETYIEDQLEAMTMSYGIDGDSGQTGDYNDYNIDNSVLSAALPINFKFLWFDCCLMGNVETLYEYRTNAETIIASPQEILSYGMPYEKVLPYMISGDYDGGAQAFYEHYAYSSKDLTTNYTCSPYATIAVYDPTKFDTLATVIAEQTARCGGYPDSPSISGVQTMAYTSTYQKKFFDLSDAIGSLFDDQAVSAVDQVLSELITYKAATAYFGSISLDKYCGISTYIPRSGYSTTSVETYYNTLSWAKAIGWNQQE